MRDQMDARAAHGRAGTHEPLDQPHPEALDVVGQVGDVVAVGVARDLHEAHARFAVVVLAQDGGHRSFQLPRYVLYPYGASSSGTCSCSSPASIANTTATSGKNACRPVRVK